VIASADSDDAARPLCFAQHEHAVESAAHLERAGLLEHLQFEVNVCTNLLAQRVARDQRRAMDERRDALARVPHILRNRDVERQLTRRTCEHSTVPLATTSAASSRSASIRFAYSRRTSPTLVN